jgi:sulfoxide reductase heme-binding subunit YedZ
MQEKPSIAVWSLWAVLAAPGVLWIADTALTADPVALSAELIHPSGVIAAWLVILTLMVTPLRLLFPGARWAFRLQRNRRYLGVAGFGYATLHTGFYLIETGSAARVIADLPRFDIWTGWLALLILLPLAVTSADFFVRRMGRWWKALQRWAYAAMVLTVVHVVSLNQWSNPWEPLVHVAPLAVLEAWRIRRHLRGRRRGIGGAVADRSGRSMPG